MVGLEPRCRPLPKPCRQATALFLLALSAAVPARLGATTTSTSRPSTCFGTSSHGRLENGCQLPRAGAGFEAYSHVGVDAGRTFVHCRVRYVVVSAYESLHASHPEWRFVYGETGLRTGGPFPPHKTHRNGLSVDFMVPVRDSRGSVARLPDTAQTRYGYDTEFDHAGRAGALSIDFEALASHLAALAQSASEYGAPIRRVTFDPELQRRLRTTSAWPKIAHLPFTRRSAWVRHDEHYHVDFDVPCAPDRPGRQP